nr:ABC transporter ATP-binding protein [uncultured Mogibacterium sp.]
MTENRSNTELLNIEDFSMCFDGEQGVVHAVQGVSLTVKSGEIMAIVGESGSGKTALCFSILMLHRQHARHLSGSICLSGKDVTKMGEKELEQIRGKAASIVFQDPLNSLDPVRTVGEQITTPMKLHEDGEHVEAEREYDERAVGLLREMGMKDAEKYLSCYPHQLSGGQRQRVAVAIALACDPALIIADEPTTALDPRNQKQIISVLKRLAAERDKGILFITHDLGLARELATKIAVMKDGRFVEADEAEEIFENPKHEYTKALVRYSQYGKMGSHYHGNFGQMIGNRDEIIDKVESSEKIMIAKDIDMIYRNEKQGCKKVLSGYSLDVVKGEILGLVGQSGCGKSTLARIIMGLTIPNGGSVKWGRCGSRDRREVRTQMIFQDSASAFNPRMTIEEIISEPLVIDRVGNREERRSKVMEVMKQVHLDEELMKRHPYDVSGGQRQRAAIARALITEPDFIIADEPLSSLDVPTAAEIVHLLREIHDERQLTMILISHDIPMVEHVCDRIVSMDE